MALFICAAVLGTSFPAKARKAELTYSPHCPQALAQQTNLGKWLGGTEPTEESVQIQVNCETLASGADSNFGLFQLVLDARRGGERQQTRSVWWGQMADEGWRSAFQTQLPKLAVFLGLALQGRAEITVAQPVPAVWVRRLERGLRDTLGASGSVGVSGVTQSGDVRMAVVYLDGRTRPLHQIYALLKQINVAGALSEVTQTSSGLHIRLTAPPALNLPD